MSEPISAIELLQQAKQTSKMMLERARVSDWESVRELDDQRQQAYQYLFDYHQQYPTTETEVVMMQELLTMEEQLLAIAVAEQSQVANDYVQLIKSRSAAITIRHW